MEQRRIELGIEWKDVATRANVSYETIRHLRKGTRAISALKARHIEEALEWEPGSIQDVLEGGEPTPLKPDETDTEPRIRTLQDADAYLDTAEPGEREMLAAILRHVRGESRAG